MLVKNLLHDELHIDTTVTQCVRLGKPRAHSSQPLLATLADENDAREAIRLVKSLRDSARKEISENVFLNPDLTKEQLTIQYNLRHELKRRKASGETDIVIKNDRIVHRTPRTDAAATATSATPSGMPAPSATAP